ncbi:hypothetical protein [Sinomonas soli]
MTNTEHLARLINAHRASYGWTIPAMAERIGVKERTLSGWIAGEYAPRHEFRPTTEKAFEWAPGSIANLLKADNPEAYELSTMAAADEGPVRRASELTDDELLMELAHRMREWRTATA